MAKAKPKDSDSFRGSILLAVTALVLFVAGEAVILARTDAGRLTVARFVGSDDPARSTQLGARQVRHALEAADVPKDLDKDFLNDVGRLSGIAEHPVCHVEN